MATATISKSKQTKKYGSAADIITVTGSSNKIYTNGGKDKVTLSKGSSNMIDTGAGNDIITVKAGNKHTLRGGTGSDKYVVNSAITKSTRLTINQSDYKKKDADTLQLSNVKLSDVYYSLDKGNLIITHANGGKITVAGWDKNPLAKIEFANHKPGPFDTNYVTGKQINNYLALASGKVINVNKKGTYKATKSKDLFRFSGFGWTATITGADKSDALDLTRYNLEYVDWGGFKKSGNDLCLTLVKEGKGTKSSRTATIKIKNYFTSTNRLGKMAVYEHGDAQFGNGNISTHELSIFHVGMNLRYGEDGTKEDDYIQAAKAGTLKGGAGNDTIFGSAGRDKLYGGDGDDEISGGAGNDELYGGAGNDSMDGDEGDDILHGGPGDDWLNDQFDEGTNTVYGDAGNDQLDSGGRASHYLNGGTGSDTYYIDWVDSGVNITIDQRDYNKGDKDVLYLGYVYKDYVNYSLKNGTLTIEQNYGGKITVKGWDKNPLSKIVFADKVSVTGSAINKWLNSGYITNISKSGTYNATNFDDTFRFTGTGWDATVVGMTQADALDFSSYEGNYGAALSKTGNSLKINFAKYDGDSETQVGVVSLYDYFGKQNNSFKFIRYNPDTKKKQTATVIVGDDDDYGVTGTDGDDWIVSGNGNKTVNAGKGNDMIQVGWGDLGSEGTQIINAGSGNDEIYADGGTNILNGGDNNDIIFVENTNNNVLNGNAGDDTLEVYGDGHTLNGGDGDDKLIVRHGNNCTLNGGGGNDTLYGGDGNDNLNGGEGTDILIGGAGSNELTGGDGADTFVYSGAGNDVVKDYEGTEDVIEFTGGTIADTGFTGKNLVYTFDNGKTLTVENIAQRELEVKDQNGKYRIFFQGDQIILGSDYTGTFDMNTYADIDRIYAYGMANITIFGNKMNNHFNVGSNNSTVYGGEGDDIFFVTNGNHILIGGAGNDTIYGGSGRDIFVYDSGNDTIYNYELNVDTIQINNATVNGFVRSDADITLALTSNGLLTVKDVLDKGLAIFIDGDTVSSFVLGTSIDAYMHGTEGNDFILGGAGDDHLYGETGNDNLYGDEGNDTLYGGQGDDMLYGGAGNDTFVYADGDGIDVVKDYEEGKDTLQISAGSITKAEKKDGAVILTVGTGSITLEGASNKTIQIQDNNGKYTLSAEKINLDPAYTGIMDANTLLSSVITIDGQQTSSITIIGNAQNNEIFGSSGSDTLYGGEGNDSMHGDVLRFYRLGEDDYLDGGAGDDYLDGGAGNDELHGGDGNDGLEGSFGADTMFGEAGDDNLIGGPGLDHLCGGAGNDELCGGEGPDVFTFYDNDGDDVITDYSWGENDIIQLYTTVMKAELINNERDVKFTTEGGSIVLKNAGANPVYIESDDKKYYVSKNAINIYPTSTGTLDINAYFPTITSVFAYGAEVELNIIGNAQDNIIYAGTSGGAINGGAGNDTLYGDAGRDTLYGGDGSDILYGGDGMNGFYGGSDNDIFCFNSESKGSNSIFDYEVGLDIIKFEDNIGIADSSVNTSGDVHLKLTTGGTVDIISAAGKNITFDYGNGNKSDLIFS